MMMAAIPPASRDAKKKFARAVMFSSWVIERILHSHASTRGLTPAAIADVSYGERGHYVMILKWVVESFASGG
jgi:hypothetical protein